MCAVDNDELRIVGRGLFSKRARGGPAMIEEATLKPSRLFYKTITYHVSVIASFFKRFYIRYNLSRLSKRSMHVNMLEVLKIVFSLGRLFVSM